MPDAEWTSLHTQQLPGPCRLRQSIPEEIDRMLKEGEPAPDFAALDRSHSKAALLASFPKTSFQRLTSD